MNIKKGLILNKSNMHRYKNLLFLGQNTYTPFVLESNQ